MKPRMESNTSSAVVISVDIGKDIFHLVGFAADGKIAFRSQRCLREAAAVHRRHGSLPERAFCRQDVRALGHEPRIVPAIYVKPFVKGQKNDYNARARMAPPAGVLAMP